MNFITRLLLSALAVFLLAYFLPGIAVDSLLSALIVSVVLSVLNTLVKPILVILTLPATIFSLGLFLLVINAVLILLADYLISGFHVSGFWTALIFSVLLSILQSLFFASGKKSNS